MSDTNETTQPDAYSTESVYGDNPANETASELQEELFELIEGKNPDGTPIKKQLKRDELLKLAQQGFGASKSFEEAKAAKEQMKQLARMLQDPEKVFEVLKQLGHDPDQLMTGRMANQMLENMKTPEEKEMEQLRREAEEFRRFKAQQMKEQEESQIEHRAAEIRNSLYSRIEETLNTAGVPKTRATIAEVSRYIKMMADASERNGESFDIDSVKLNNIVAHLREKHKQTFESLFDELDDDGILAMLPESIQKKIGAALTKKLSGGKVADINSIRRPAKSNDSLLDAPADKPKIISMKEADAITENRIRKAQELWDRQNKR